MRIAVPLNSERMSKRFSDATNFRIYEMSFDDKTIRKVLNLNVENVHSIGFPGFLAVNNVNVVLVGVIDFYLSMQMRRLNITIEKGCFSEDVNFVFVSYHNKLLKANMVDFSNL